MATPVYSFLYEVDCTAMTVSPVAPQRAGCYGDHHFAAVRFELKNNSAADTYRYRIEIVDGSGAYDITELLSIQDGAVEYTIPCVWTAPGLATLRLIQIEVASDGSETASLHYPPVHLIFEQREGADMGEVLPIWQSVMTKAENGAASAVVAAANVSAVAEEARKATSDAEVATTQALEAAASGNQAAVSANSAALRAETAAEKAELVADDLEGQFPNIRDGEWYLGEEATGVPTTGPQGEKGEKGEKGEDGAGRAVENGGVIFNDYDNNTATGECAAAFNFYTSATGNRASAFGYQTLARGKQSFATGQYTEAREDTTYVAGIGNIAAYYGQYVCGRYNQHDDNWALFTVGNGNSDEERSNAFTVMEDGSARVMKTGDNDNAVTQKSYVDGAVAAVNTAVANALKGTFSGESVCIADVSPVQQELSVTVNRRNLIPYPYLETTKTQNGITFTDNGDGSVTVTGTATGDTFFFLTNAFIPPTVNEPYTVTGCPAGGGSGAYVLDCYGGGISYSADAGNGMRITFTQKTNATFRITVYSGATVDNVTFYPQLELGLIATAYTPYIPDLPAVTVTRCGKNLLAYPYLNTTRTENGITFTDNGDGSVTVTGTATGDTFFFLTNAFIPPTVNEPYTVTGCPAGGGSGAYVLDCYGGGISYSADAGNGMRITFTKKTNATFRITVYSGATVDNVTFYPQLEKGDTATAYQPYQEAATYTPNPDGTVDGVTGVYPATALFTDTAGAVLEGTYNRDINQAFAELQQAIISLGGNV